MQIYLRPTSSYHLCLRIHHGFYHSIKSHISENSVLDSHYLKKKPAETNNLQQIKKWVFLKHHWRNLDRQ